MASNRMAYILYLIMVGLYGVIENNFKVRECNGKISVIG
mgnify:FL=1